MLKGNWRHIGAIGLVLALAGGPASAKHNHHPHRDRANASDAQETKATTSPQPTAYQYPYPCQKPQNAEQDNLCLERESADAAVQSASWAKATFWVGIAGTIAVALTLGANAWSALAAWKSAEASFQQIKLSREEFNATHRPKIRVRNFVTKPFKTGDIINGQFYAANIGDAPGAISEYHCEVVWNIHDLPMERPYEGKAGNGGRQATALVPGASYPLLFQSETFFPDMNFVASLYIMGWVEYVDASGVRRRTAFCRKYGKGRFRVIDEPDYEHEE